MKWEKDHSTTYNIDLEIGGSMNFNYFETSRDKARQYGAGGRERPPFIPFTKELLKAIYVMLRIKVKEWLK